MDVAAAQCSKDMDKDPSDSLYIYSYICYAVDAADAAAAVEVRQLAPECTDSKDVD